MHSLSADLRNPVIYIAFFFPQQFRTSAIEKAKGGHLYLSTLSITAALMSSWRRAHVGWCAVAAVRVPVRCGIWAGVLWLRCGCRCGAASGLMCCGCGAGAGAMDPSTGTPPGRHRAPALQFQKNLFATMGKLCRVWQTLLKRVRLAGMGNLCGAGQSLLKQIDSTHLPQNLGRLL